MSQDYNYGDYNRGGMWAFAIAMLVTLIFFIYVAFIHSGVDLKEMEQSGPEKEQPADSQKNPDETPTQPGGLDESKTQNP